MAQTFSMTYNPISIAKPQRNTSQLHPVSGTNSWAVEVSIGSSHIAEQQSDANRNPNSKNNSWAGLDEEVIPVKEKLIKKINALKSIPHGTSDNKPLPPIPQLPPPPCTPRLTPSKAQAQRLHSSFPGAFSSINFVTRIRRQADVKLDRVSSGIGQIQLGPKPQRITVPSIPKMRLPQKDEGVPQDREERIGALFVATGSEISPHKTSAQPTNTSKVPQVLDANPPEDQSHIKLPSDSPSKILSSPPTASNSDQSSSPVNSVRQLISEADPTIRYLLENKLPTLTISGRYRNKSGILREGGVRKPRRAGTLSETRRVHFAAINETRRHSSAHQIIENDVYVNHQQGENKVETTIPGPGYSPTECFEKAIVCPKSNFNEEHESNTVS